VNGQLGRAFFGVSATALSLPFPIVVSFGYLLARSHVSRPQTPCSCLPPSWFLLKLRCQTSSRSPAKPSLTRIRPVPASALVHPISSSPSATYPTSPLTTTIPLYPVSHVDSIEADLSNLNDVCEIAIARASTYERASYTRQLRPSSTHPRFKPLPKRMHQHRSR